MAVRLFYEGTRFRLRDREASIRWLKQTAKAEGKTLGDVNYILCSDAVLLPLNQSYLKHNTLTDIITFQYHKRGEPLVGEIYISIERVRDNAVKFGVSTKEELHRVMVHGLLHLMGYTDKTASAKARMRKKEDAYLSLWK
jgi:rRNA maturation RNase YbeY